MNDLTGLTSNLIGHQRYIAILIDEMKIKSNLFFDKHSGELTGFVDLRDPDKIFTSMNPEDENLVSHALALHLRGVCTELKYILAFFTTRGVTSTQLFPMFWEEVSLLEMTCNLWVVAVASDEATPNRIFYLLRSELDGKGNRDICYRTQDLFAPSRFIFFFADAQHLIKTARNCLYHSGSGRCTRYMWNDRKYLLWQHIIQVYQDELENGLNILPKLTRDQVYLTPFSVMTVKYAVQIFSETM